MQSSEVISVNIWQIIISICNLLILFLILKKFLYKPVQNMLAQRQGLIDKDLESAREADKAAQANKKLYEEKLKNADEEAARSSTTPRRRRRESLTRYSQMLRIKLTIS